MQFVSSIENRALLAKRERTVGDKLPYAAQFDDRTLQLRGGMLMQVVRLGGLLFETADTDELNYRKVLREALLQALSSPRFAVYHHIVRRRVDAVANGRFSDRFSAGLDAAWQQRLGSRQLYVNDLFLTIVRRPLKGRLGIADRFSHIFTGKQSATVDRASDLRALGMAVDQVVAALAQYEPQILATYETEHGAYSEPLEFLSMILNGELRPVRLPEASISDYLPYRRISFGQDLVELGSAGDLPREFQAIVSIKDYPGTTTPGMLDQLLRLPVEMVVSQSFGFVERQAGLGRMNLALRRMRASDDEALSLRSELSVAKDDLAAGRTAFGEHHLSIAIRGSERDQVNSHVAEVQSALADLGLISVREEIGLEAAYWAQFPGNFSYIARRALISSRNFASFASYHNFPRGRATGNHWGDAVTTLESTAAGPYHFNFHKGDLGNFTIIGPSGSGKTVVLNFLLAQARKFEPRIIFFDKDRGAELFIRSIGGIYDVLRPGMAAALNPLQIPDTAENRRFLIDWIGRLVLRPGDQLTAEETHRIQEAVDASYAAPIAHRRLRYFAQLFRGGERPHANDLWSRLRPWWGEGEHAWLFDNAEDRTDIGALTVGFDMTRILDNATLRTPAMMYLFHRVEERLDGTPSIIVIDEGWKALDDDVFVQKIKDWEKTIRKRNGIVGFATQSAEDALASKISSAIVEQAATQIFMTNAKARREDYCDGFGLTAQELDLIRSLPDDAHCFLIKHGNDSVVVRLDLSGEKDILTILSGRERTVRLLDEIREQVGDNPDAWLPRLLEVA